MSEQRSWFALIIRLAILGLVWALAQHLADLVLGEHFLGSSS